MQNDGLSHVFLPKELSQFYNYQKVVSKALSGFWRLAHMAHLSGWDRLDDHVDGASHGFVTAEKDGGVINCYQFTIHKEDHTLGNLLIEKLLEEERVLFAGYRIHHPMDDWIYMRVNVSDEIVRPSDLVKQTVVGLTSEIRLLAEEFELEVERKKNQDLSDRRYGRK
jgi:DNA-directed RNA polymerase II subunit RPB11